MSEWSEIERLGAGIRRFWWVVSLGTVVAAALGFFVTKAMTPVYEAKTTLLVGQLSGAQVDNSAVRARQGLAAVYADLLRRQPVLAPAAEKLDVKGGWKVLQQRVRVSVPHEDTQLIMMTVEGGSPADAERAATAITDQLKALTDADAPVAAVSPKFAAAQMTRLERDIQDNQAEMAQLRKTLPPAATAQATPDRATQATQDRIDLLNQQVIDWQRIYLSLQEAVRAPSGNGVLTVLDEAKADSTPVRPNVRFNVVIAGFAGLVLGLIGVYVAAGRLGPSRPGNAWYRPGAAPFLDGAEQGAARDRSWVSAGAGPR